MSADISTNWLDGFKEQIKCGKFPSTTSNPKVEMLSGLAGIAIEHLICINRDALLCDVTSEIITDNDGCSNLAQWYERIKCGEFFESDAQGFAVLAMIEQKRLEYCEATEDELEAEQDTDVKTVTVFTGDEYNMVAEDLDSPQPPTLILTSANPETFIVPLNATLSVAIGSRFKLVQGGAGLITIAGETGAVIVNSLGGLLDFAGQWGVVWLEKIAVNTWVADGDLA